MTGPLRRVIPKNLIIADRYLARKSGFWEMQTEFFSRTLRVLKGFSCRRSPVAKPMIHHRLDTHKSSIVVGIGCFNRTAKVDLVSFDDFSDCEAPAVLNRFEMRG